jgi:hypothetical protein
MPGRRRPFVTDQELKELERTDPAVADARRRFDQLSDDFARYERHLAARKAVGKRPMPKEEE